MNQGLVIQTTLFQTIGGEVYFLLSYPTISGRKTSFGQEDGKGIEYGDGIGPS